MIPVNAPLITDDDVAAVSSVLNDGWISSEAPVVAEFEEAFARAHGQSNGVSVPNGSIALDLAIATLELGPGDEVIMPTFTIISCIAEILRRGATPVFVDSCSTTWNMDVSQVEVKINDRTRAILVVHTYGLPVDMDPLIAVADANGLVIIEDAAEAHGLFYRDRVCGSMGFVSTFSFYANKNVTTGEGGMILTSDSEFADKLRYFRNLAFQPERRFQHYELGWNYRFTAIQAALGLSQLRRLPQTILKRREIASRYIEALKSIPGVVFAPDSLPYGTNDYWVVGITLDHELFGKASKVQESLHSAGVGTRPFFYPMHLQPLKGRKHLGTLGEYPVSEFLGDQGFYLPNGLGMSEEDLGEAVVITQKVLSR